MYVHQRDEKLREAILKKFRSFADFSSFVGDHPSIVSCLVNRRRKLSPKKAAKWAKALNCRPEDLSN